MARPHFTTTFIGTLVLKLDLLSNFKIPCHLIFSKVRTKKVRIFENGYSRQTDFYQPNKEINYKIRLFKSRVPNQVVVKVLRFETNCHFLTTIECDFDTLTVRRVLRKMSHRSQKTTEIRARGLHYKLKKKKQQQLKNKTYCVMLFFIVFSEFLLTHDLTFCKSDSSYLFFAVCC